jgi:hypothetical protein|tara:strand:+ start:232 stop:534 length:303 start_codon:yes stop_codon:yes gene_type:complete
MKVKRVAVFDANVTHNLTKMADEAGVYDCCWRPEERGYGKASQLIDPLRKGIADMKARPEHFKQFNASNGWGLYKHFLPWLERLLRACEDDPDADIWTSR